MRKQKTENQVLLCVRPENYEKYLSSVPLITKVKPAKQSGAPSGTS